MHKSQNYFLDYLESDRFYDKIYNRIFLWCTKNRDILLNKINGYDVKYITEVEDVELDFKNVWIESKENTKIEFDIAIEITVEVVGVSGKYNDIESYTSRLWIKLNCLGTLNKKLNDFYIYDIDEYSKSSPKKPLSGNMVPYISKLDYNKYANEILEKYYYPHYPDAKTKPQPINVDKLAEKMGLKVIDRSITKDKTVFGQIFFSDTNVKLYNNLTNQYEKTLVTQNTILVDSGAAYLRSYGSRNMTVAHECVHFYYHINAFYFAKLFSEELKYIECQVDGTMRNAESNETANWMEIQANGLAPYILMPEESFLPYAKILFQMYYKEVQIGTGYINNIIDTLAFTYDVTIYAARKRLIDLGFEEAIGAYNWVDGHYVRPYSFKKGSLEYNETFTISYKDVYKKVISDQKIMPYVFQNEYVFVENHLCINNPNYVEKDNEGNLLLTDYALLHMDECCIKFKYKTLNGFTNGYDLGLMAYLSRDISKEIEFDLEISGVVTATNDDLFKERYKVHTENVTEVIKRITGLSFGEIIRFLMEYLDISLKELEFDSGLNEKTIRRYTSGENKEPDKRSVVALLRALNLPPRITTIALNQAGIIFRTGHDEDDALFNVLINFRNSSAKEANDFMIKVGFDPLTKNL
ncbi:MAG: ImmA/IrrE family metallo-endopeptidase [Acholeplasmataceae bacterium]